MLNNIELDDQEEAAKEAAEAGCPWAWAEAMEEDITGGGNTDAEWKEPRVHSAHWFALRKDQPVYQGLGLDAMVCR
ncbi:TPA: hypothetical protein ACH3X1_006192 [Trebouxia sp. C0004]